MNTKHVSCKFCGKQGLHWLDGKGGPVLMDGERPHRCKMLRPKSSAGFGTQSNQVWMTPPNPKRFVSRGVQP